MYLWLIILGILLLIVLWNSKRAMKKQRNRKSKNFRKEYMDRKKEREKGA